LDDAPDLCPREDFAPLTGATFAEKALQVPPAFLKAVRFLAPLQLMKA